MKPFIECPKAVPLVYCKDCVSVAQEQTGFWCLLLLRWTKRGRSRSTVWEGEKSWRLQERESFNEKVSWLQSHNHMTLMTDWCRTCCGKVWKDHLLYQKKNKTGTPHILSLWYHRLAKCSQKSSYVSSVRMSLSQFRPLHQDLVDKGWRQSGDENFLRFFYS